MRKTYLNLEILELDIADHVDKASIGCYISIGDRLHDVVVFSNVNGPIQIPVNSVDETMRIYVKQLGAEEVTYGKLCA